MLVPTVKAPVDLIGAVLDSLTSKNTRAAYSRELRLFTAFCAESGLDLSRMTVQLYRSHLMAQGKSSSATNLALSAVKCLVREAAEQGCLDDGTAGAILRIRGVEKRGRRIGNWLSLEDAKRLIDAPDRSTQIGRRDSALLALLVGGALRREEAAALTVDQWQERDGRWLLADILGKHHRVRSVVLPTWAVQRIAEWISEIGPGRILRGFDRFGNQTDSITGGGIAWVIKRYAGDLGLTLACHDCRRTAAALMDEGGAPLQGIRDHLGHGSVTVTEKYLGQIRLTKNPAVDKMGLG